MQFFRYNLVYKEKFIYRIRTKVVFWLQEIFEQPCSQVWIACFLNFKSHITRQASLFAGYGETVNPRQEEASAKFCSFYLLCILCMLFFKSYKFPENNPLSCVFAYLTWVVDVTRMCFGEFVETLYSEKRKYGENKGENNFSRVMDADQSYLK